MYVSRTDRNISARTFKWCTCGNSKVIWCMHRSRIETCYICCGICRDSIKEKWRHSTDSRGAKNRNSVSFKTYNISLSICMHLSSQMSGDGSQTSAERSLKLAKSAASLFAFLTETRYLRLEDLHYGSKYVCHLLLFTLRRMIYILTPVIYIN